MSEEKLTLYRYRHLDGEHHDWTKKIITESILYFASPATFNDPFDCRVHFSKDYSKEELSAYFIEKAKEFEPEMKSDELNERAEAILKQDRNEMVSQMKKGLQGWINNYGILSLSANNNNILMWSHYAAGHKGICLRFEFTLQICNQFPYLCPAPVKYKESYPEVEITAPAKELSDAFLLTKAYDWCYEAERRTIDFTKGPGEKQFPLKLLTGVILGAEMKPEVKKKVAGWVRARKTPTELLEAFIVEGEFKIDFKLYEGD
ncbi:MAG: DUF2971 domain-containing protein [Nitrospirae bacterium]|nr:DUF2971 domain-containing protein [Nitrospirota bacterium]